MSNNKVLSHFFSGPGATFLKQEIVSVGWQKGPIHQTIPSVKRPPNSAEKWDALLYAHGLEGDSCAEDKLERHLADAQMFDMAWMVTHNGGGAIKYDTKFVDCIFFLCRRLEQELRWRSRKLTYFQVLFSFGNAFGRGKRWAFRLSDCSKFLDDLEKVDKKVVHWLKKRDGTTCCRSHFWTHTKSVDNGFDGQANIHFCRGIEFDVDDSYEKKKNQGIGDAY
ncbi:hypothetical protein IFM89_011030 [Coptis chinensis]|uniref:Uncharacterized protein n=1 Tax=Coptis chinensis TaxID=261450 RepID=A0A835IM11_9MAGN|nr:hypothetical protein IFM89_011030 [Coptis chinensis]